MAAVLVVAVDLAGVAALVVAEAALAAVEHRVVGNGF